MALLDLRLREFLDEIAAEGRTPGGGSGAALVTAIAAGLLAKVARSSGDTQAATDIAQRAASVVQSSMPVARSSSTVRRVEAGQGSSARRCSSPRQAQACA